MAQIIPLDSTPDQSFQIQLNVDGTILRLGMRLRFSTMAGYWILAVDDAAGNPILDSVPLLAGDYPAGNILTEYSYLKIGSAFVINASGVESDYPNDTNLGTDFLLLWDDTPAA